MPGRGRWDPGSDENGGQRGRQDQGPGTLLPMCIPNPALQSWGMSPRAEWESGSELTNTRDPRARPAGIIYPKLRRITEVVVTALGFAKQLGVYKPLFLSLRVTQNVAKDINPNRTNSKKSSPRRVAIKLAEN